MDPKHTKDRPPTLSEYATTKKQLEGCPDIIHRPAENLLQSHALARKNSRPQPTPRTKKILIKSEVLAIQIYFSLPAWFPPDRLDTSGSRHYYRRAFYKNSALDSLMRLKYAKTFDIGQIIFEYPPGCNINKQIKKTRDKIDRLINRYKEANQEGD